MTGFVAALPRSSVQAVGRQTGRTTFRHPGGASRPDLECVVLPISMRELLHEFYLFIRERKKLWIIPILFILLLLSGLITLTAGSALAPFIYSLF